MQAKDIVKNHQLNLLLVEDDEVDAIKVNRALQKKNLNLPLRWASNGLEALGILERCYGENASSSAGKLLILLDLNMPKMGGVEFLRILRSHKQFCKIPVIVLTTSDREQDLADAYNLNVAGYIVKPVDFTHFVDIIDVISRYWTICKFPNEFRS